jgi:hypothetical protein
MHLHVTDKNTILGIFLAYCIFVDICYVYPANIQDTSEAINLWVIVGSVLGALVVCVVLGVILWKVIMPIRVIL